MKLFRYILTLALMAASATACGAETLQSAEPVDETSDVVVSEPDQTTEDLPEDEPSDASDGNEDGSAATMVPVGDSEVDCEFHNAEASKEESLWNFRESRDIYLGFDSDVVRSLRLEQDASYVDVAAHYGVSEDALYASIETFHRHCFQELVANGELQQAQANSRFEATMERFTSLAPRTPSEVAAGPGLGNGLGDE